MRTAKTVVATMVVSLFFFSATGYAAGGVKIGIVDFQRVLAEASAGKTAHAELARQRESMKADLEKKKVELEEMGKRIEREALVMSKEQKAEKENEFRNNLRDFQALQKKYTTDDRAIETRLLKRIQIDVFTLAKKIAEEEGFTLILEKNEAGIFYSQAAMDISDKLIIQYNADFAKKSTEPAKKTE